MRDPQRIPEILALLVKIWSKEPDLRLGQILVNATGHMDNMFNIEDDKMLEGLKKFHKGE